MIKEKIVGICMKIALMICYLVIDVNWTGNGIYDIPDIVVIIDIVL